jgi:cytochrome oxidase Cu insertion factor (SCO1/SenC/PrrC family)
MRTRVLIAAAIAFAIAAAACTRQEPPANSQGGPIAVGDTAPAFTLKSATGGTISLSDYAHKAVLLYFSMGPG